MAPYRRSQRGKPQSLQPSTDAPATPDPEAPITPNPKRKRGPEDAVTTPMPESKRAFRRRPTPTPGTPSRSTPARTTLVANSAPLPQALSLTSSSTILLLPLADGTIALNDLEESAPQVPSNFKCHLFTFRMVVDGSLVDTGITTERLISTPSDFRSIILDESFSPADRQAMVRSNLRNLALESEPDVRTVTDYIITGRFNSSTHNTPPLTYSITRSISLLSFASRHAMSRLITLILTEMNREFLTSPTSTITEPITITAADLERMSRIPNPDVKAWLRRYIIDLFSTPKGEHEDGKSAYEAVIRNVPRTDIGGIEDVTMLQRIALSWFDENHGRRGVKWTGDLARLRQARPKRNVKALSNAGRGRGGRKQGKGASRAGTIERMTPAVPEHGDPGRDGGNIVEVGEMPAPVSAPVAAPATTTLADGKTKITLKLKFSSPPGPAPAAAPSSPLSDAISLASPNTARPPYLTPRASTVNAEDCDVAVNNAGNGTDVVAGVAAGDVYFLDNTFETALARAEEEDSCEVDLSAYDEPMISQEENKDYYERIEKARAIHPILMDKWRM